MPVSALAALLHVIMAFWLVAGIIGRSIAFQRARRATDVRVVVELLELVDQFERRMVMPASEWIIVFGVTTAWLRHYPMLGFLQGATSNWLLVSIVLYLGLIPPVVIWIIPRRKQRIRLTQDAATQGIITPELTAALHDRVVRAYRIAEGLVVAIVVVLMVTKPF
jgi:uncharacterized membrane protein